jgi:hypothetical protein
MPPVVDASGMPNNKAFVTPEFLPSDVSSGITMTNTMVVVAVFDSNIEAIIVVVIMPINKFLGLVPAILSVNLKSASSSFVFSIALARKKPPNRSHIILSENVLTYSSTFSGAELKYLFPKAKTRNAMIKRLTANAGIGSVIHNATAKNNRKRTYTCESLNPGSFKSNVNPTAITNESRKLKTGLLRPTMVFESAVIFINIEMITSKFNKPGQALK